MIIMRLAAGVTQHFTARRSEWFMAVGLTGWGCVVTKPSAIFASSPAYTRMAEMAPEQIWGWGAFAIGFLRLLALIVNGTFPNTLYATVSPYVRGIAAYASCFVWASICIGLLSSPIDTPGAPIYLILFGLDFANGYSAMHDAGRARGAKKHGVT
ncbi:hypothetical protein ABEG18_12920 [Alsobacter sp. KACC 23698]|uniref:Uncharacterized protein n=1 Tax=Alsobacter sp. KACC 23698 TaxID=3149229 RepID=A0AAU7JN37_9HYPH